MSDPMQKVYADFARVFAEPVKPPTGTDIAQLVAERYGVSLVEAMCWCLNAFGDEQ